MKKLIYTALGLFTLSSALAQGDEARLLDNFKVNQDYPHGSLPYVSGVHNIQTMRANRERPELGDGFGWTYNHAANLAYWNGTFYYHYLSDPHGEHIPSSQTLLQTSRDGYNWQKPMVLFPPYRIPNGYSKQGSDLVAQDIDAVMHQRMGFYVTKNGSKLLALGYYGVCLAEKGDSPLDGNGIGRVVREINRDGSFGPIYFIRINHEWNESTVDYPFYKRSKDKAFVAACDELLADPLMMQQWVEEADRDDPLIPVPKPGLKGFNYTELPDGRLFAVWKSGLYAFSSDRGCTWTEHKKIENIITGTAKCWVERMSDGTYALVYNPTYFRYPMAVATSTDGLNWDNLRNVHGEVSPMRYSGNEKSWGPQYLRGIMPGNGVVPDGHMWLAYSVNKEDMWIMRVTAPLEDKATSQIDEDLSKYNALSELTRWNIYSPLWSPVTLQKAPNGENALRLADWDPYDYAKAEHYFPESEIVTVEFSVIPEQNNTGSLCVELQNSVNYAGTRVCFDADGMIRFKRGYKYSELGPYQPGEKYDVKVEADAKTQLVTVTVNDRRPVRNVLYGQVDNFSKVVFRTGELMRILNVDIPAYGEWVLPGAGEPVAPASFYLLSLKTQSPQIEQNTTGSHVFHLDPGVLKQEFIYESASYPECHASTIAETPEGLVAAWFGGTKERNPDVCIWVSRYENGQWTEGVNVANGIMPDGERFATWNPVLFQVPGGDLWLFYKVGPNVAGWSGWWMKSQDHGRTWSKSEQLPEGFLGPIKNNPVMLSDGTILCPSSREGAGGWRVVIEYTRDLGKTWHKTEPINDGVEMAAIQPSILVHQDGRLQVLCRSKNRAILESWSSDNGMTWSPMQKALLPNNNSGTDAVTLQDGRNLLVYNHVLPPGDLIKGPRTPLNVSVTEDGKNWYAAAILEDSPISQYSYPSVIQTSDGLVHVVYTWRRQRIVHAVIDPSQLKLEKMVDGQWPYHTKPPRESIDVVMRNQD